MGVPFACRGTVGTAGQMLWELARVLTWGKKDWIDFEIWLDAVERAHLSGLEKGKKKDRQWRRTARGLQYRKAVLTKRIGSRVYVRLSDTAWRRVWVERIRRERRLNTHGYCIVTFDVPETHRSERNVFRKFLKQCGFKVLHKSVLYSPRDVTAHLLTLIEELGLASWVTVVEGFIRTKAAERA